MAYKDLYEFLERLEREGELVKVKQEIDPKFEVSALFKEFGNRNGPVALIEKVKGYDVPIVGNLMGSKRRLALALETTEEKFIGEYEKRLGKGIPPVKSKEAPVKEVICKGDEVDILRDIPVPTLSEGDVSPYINGGIVFLKDPVNGRRSMGIHRLQVKGRNKLAVYLSEGSVISAKILNDAENAQRAAEVAIALGVEPAILIASISAAPIVPDKMQLAGSLRGEAVEVVKGETVDIEVPARAMFILEGKIPPGVRELNGPFGESSGYYTSVQTPVTELTALTYRKKPMLSIIEPFSPDDLLFSNIIFGRQMYGALHAMFPCLKEAVLWGEHALFVMSVRKENEWDTRHLLNLALTLFSLVKFAIVVDDDDVDVHNMNEVMWALAGRFRPERDLVQIHGVLGDVLDPSLEGAKTGSKLGFDATKPLERAELYRRVDVPQESKGKVQEILKGLGF